MSQFENLTYRKALPLMWGMIDFFCVQRKSDGTADGTVYGAGNLEKCLKTAVSPEFMNAFPLKTRNNLWRQNRCVYCKTDDLPDETEGDHVLRKDPRKNVDLDCYTVPACENCNEYLKKDTDLLEWLNKDNRSFLDLDWRVMGIWIQAQWKFRDFYSSNPYASEFDTLEERISDSFRKALEQLFERIQSASSDNENYQRRVKQIITSFCENVHTINDPAFC